MKSQRQHRTSSSRFLSLPIIATIVLLLMSSGSSATATSYSQAPPVGLDTGAEFLITWDGTSFTVSAPSGEGPYDGVEDTLYGVQNNSSSPLLLINIDGMGNGVFGFDGDGIDAFNGTGAPPGSPGPTGYEGWTSDSSMWGTGTPGAVFFTITDNDHGTVHFTGGIPVGGSAYFALEGRADFAGGGLSVPETGNTLSLLAIAGALLFAAKRRVGLRKAERRA